nr:Protein PRRC2C like [Ipomoea batatas]
MEINTGIPHSKEKQAMEGCKTDRETKKASENVATTPVFINHAAIAWEESRRKWVGDTSQKTQSIAKDPIISWSMTYEDLLSTNEPFAERIPLPLKVHKIPKEYAGKGNPILLKKQDLEWKNQQDHFTEENNGNKANRVDFQDSRDKAYTPTEIANACDENGGVHPRSVVDAHTEEYAHGSGSG